MIFLPPVLLSEFTATKGISGTVCCYWICLDSHLQRGFKMRISIFTFELSEIPHFLVWIFISTLCHFFPSWKAAFQHFWRCKSVSHEVLALVCLKRFLFWLGFWGNFTGWEPQVDISPRTLMMNLLSSGLNLRCLFFCFQILFTFYFLAF